MPSVFGIRPKNEFFCNDRILSLETLEIESGIFPLRLLPHRISFSMFETELMYGNLPKKKKRKKFASFHIKNKLIALLCFVVFYMNLCCNAYIHEYG